MTPLLKPRDGEYLPPGEGPAEHTARGRREWDDRLGALINRHRTDRLVTVAALGVAALAVFGYYRKETHYEPPIVIRQDSLGAFTAIARAGQDTPPDDLEVAADLKAWVRAVRTISVDTHAMREAILAAYRPIKDGAPATNQLNQFYSAKPEDDPFTRAAREIVTLSEQSALPSRADQSDSPWQQGRLSDSRTFNVEWKETTLGRDGMLRREAWWRAEIVVEWRPPESREEAERAPDGIWVRSFAWTER